MMTRKLLFTLCFMSHILTAPVLATSAITLPAGDLNEFMVIQSENLDHANQLRRFLGDESVHSWSVSLNLDMLSAITDPEGKRMVTALGDMVSGQRATLSLPILDRNSPLQLKVDTVYEGKGGVITYAGKVDDDEGSLVAITVDEETVLGRIHHSDGFTYLIETAINSHKYTLSVIDQTLIRQPERERRENLSLSENEQMKRSAWRVETNQPTSSGGVVRILVMYTPDVAQKMNITLLANNIIATFNQSLLYSGVGSSNFVTLAGLRNINNNLDAIDHRCKEEILYDKRNENEAFSSISNWMSESWADIGLTIMTTETGYTECASFYSRAYGGAAFPIPEALYPVHPSPYANTTHTFAMADLTAIHEIGHVLNGKHEDCNANTEPPFACGYAPQHCDWQTIMGGYVYCGYEHENPPGQQSTVRIGRWSNPNMNYNGEATGSEQKNMASALNINMPYAAGWKGPQPLPPQPPNPVSNQHMYCWGMNTVQWTAQTDATQYQVFETSHGIPVYSGSETQTVVNYSSPTTLTVRACNAGGCSDESHQILTAYYSGCL